MITPESILLGDFHRVLLKLHMRQLFNKDKKNKALIKSINHFLLIKYLKFTIF